MGQIIFIALAIIIIIVSKNLNKRMSKALEDAEPGNNNREEYFEEEKPAMFDGYDMQHELMTIENLPLPSVMDYKPMDYKFSYEPMGDIESEISKIELKSEEINKSSQKMVNSNKKLPKFSLRDAVIYSEILKPKYMDYN